MTWTKVCAMDLLGIDRGAAALVDGHQVEPTHDFTVRNAFP